MKFTHLTKADIDGFDTASQSALTQSLCGPAALHLIGSMDSDDRLGLMLSHHLFPTGETSNNIGILVSRDQTELAAYKHIIASKEFTVNHVQKRMVAKAHYAERIMHDAQTDFLRCGLQAQFLAEFGAPYVKEAKVKFGLRLIENLTVDSEGSRLLIGEVVHIYLEDHELDTDGTVLLQKMGVHGEL